MTPAQLAKAIAAGNLPPLLYLYGEEGFLLQRAFDQLRDAAIEPSARDFNLQVFYGRELKSRQLLEAAQTLPVFSPRRMLVVRDADAIPAAELDALCAYVSQPFDETLLCFLGTKVDARRKFFQLLKKSDVLVEFKPLPEQQLPAFVRQEAARIGLQFTEEGMALLCRRTAGSLQETVGELDKLRAYLGGPGLVDRAEVALLVANSRQESVFELTDALGQGRRREAFELLRHLLDDGEPPLRLLAMIVRHYRQLCKAVEAQAQQLPRTRWAAHVGINPYFLDGLMRQATAFAGCDFPRLFERLVGVDLALKSSGVHPQAVMELLLLELIELSGKQQRGG